MCKGVRNSARPIQQQIALRKCSEQNRTKLGKAGATSKRKIKFENGRNLDLNSRQKHLIKYSPRTVLWSNIWAVVQKAVNSSILHPPGPMAQTPEHMCFLVYAYQQTTKSNMRKRNTNIDTLLYYTKENVDACYGHCGYRCWKEFKNS